ncbi:MAG: VOC family protein [Thaumarchaeota archaeon]|nr:VOC family protein [Nitrososphaerota archaeon]
MLSKAGYATLIPVKKMSRAIKFYTDMLGGKLVYRGEGEMKDFWASVKLGKEDFWLVTPQKWEKRELSYSAFLVKNIKRTVKELQGKGVKFEPGEKMGKESKVVGPITYVPSGASAFFKDSEGNLLMVWQNDPPM